MKSGDVFVADSSRRSRYHPWQDSKSSMRSITTSAVKETLSIQDGESAFFFRSSIVYGPDSTAMWHFIGGAVAADFSTLAAMKAVDYGPTQAMVSRRKAWN